MWILPKSCSARIKESKRREERSNTYEVRQWYTSEGEEKKRGRKEKAEQDNNECALGAITNLKRN